MVQCLFERDFRKLSRTKVSSQSFIYFLRVNSRVLENAFGAKIRTLRKLKLLLDGSKSISKSLNVFFDLGLGLVVVKLAHRFDQKMDRFPQPNQS